MMCLRHAMLYILLLPIPAASPIFLVLFAITLVLTIKPCGYCLTLFTILFLSTSSQSPLYSTPVPSTTISDLNTTTASSVVPPSEISQIWRELPINAPNPERSWITLNNHYIFDPQLVAYRPKEEGRDEISSHTSTNITGEDTSTGVIHQLQQLSALIVDKLPSSFRPTPPNLTPTREDRQSPSPLPLPKGFLDLRWKEMGVVLDFGWRRSVEGLGWENEVQKRKWPEDQRRHGGEDIMAVAHRQLTRDW